MPDNTFKCAPNSLLQQRVVYPQPIVISPRLRFRRCVAVDVVSAGRTLNTLRIGGGRGATTGTAPREYGHNHAGIEREERRKRLLSPLRVRTLSRHRLRARVCSRRIRGVVGDVHGCKDGGRLSGFRWDHRMRCCVSRTRQWKAEYVLKDRRRSRLRSRLGVRSAGPIQPTTIRERIGIDVESA